MGRKAHKGEITSGGALVVRLGETSVKKLKKGAEDMGITGHAYGISVQCDSHVTNKNDIAGLIAPAQNARNTRANSVGCTTVKKVIQKGGWVQKSPVSGNPDHAVIVCAKPTELTKIFAKVNV